MAKMCNMGLRPRSFATLRMTFGIGSNCLPIALFYIASGKV